MNKSVLLIFVFLVILISSLTGPHSLVPLAIEGQTVNQNNTLNVTDLTNSNTLNSTIQLQNKTVEYYKNTSGYLVYPTNPQLVVIILTAITIHSQL